MLIYFEPISFFSVLLVTVTTFVSVIFSVNELFALSLGLRFSHFLISFILLIIVCMIFIYCKDYAKRIIQLYLSQSQPLLHACYQIFRIGRSENYNTKTYKDYDSDRRNKHRARVFRNYSSYEAIKLK